MCCGEILQVQSLEQRSRGEGSTLILKVNEFPYNVVYDGSKEAPMPKTSPIRSPVSIEHRLVTDTDTDRHRVVANKPTRDSTASRL